MVLIVGWIANKLHLPLYLYLGEPRLHKNLYVSCRRPNLEKY